MEAFNADSTAIKPLTKRTAQGELYVRRADAELQIEKVLTLETPQILEMLGAGGQRGEAGYLLDETLVYLVREARRAGDDDLLNRVYAELSRRIWKKIAKFRVNFDEQAEFEDLRQKTEMAIVRKILNVDSNAGDFAQVQFGSFVLSEAKSVWKQSLVKITKDRELFDTPRDNGEESNYLENLSSGSDEFSVESRVIFAEGIGRLTHEQQIIAALLLDGFQIESRDENELTISKHLGVTSRTIRTRIKEMRRILSV